MKALSEYLSFIVGSAACLVLMACATDESINRETSVQLEPLAMLPEPSVGQELHGLEKGKPTTTKVVAVDANLVTMTDTEGPDKGCTWTRGAGKDRFAPAVSWENCDGSTGTQDVSKSGNIWPLMVGSSESYEVTGRDQKENWSTTRKCEVESTVMISLQDKQYPTYEVVCRDSWSKRYWYVSPDLQQTIKYKKVHHKRGLEDDWVAVVK